MKNTITNFCFAKDNKSADVRFDKWLSENGIEGKVIKIWNIRHGRNHGGRSRYVTKVEIEVNGDTITLAQGHNDAHKYDAWTSINCNETFKVDRAKAQLLIDICDDKNAQRIINEVELQNEYND